MIIKEIRKNTKCAMSSKRRDICHFVWGREYIIMILNRDVFT